VFIAPSIFVGKATIVGSFIGRDGILAWAV